jgi:DNA-binding NtrC family response regulator
MFVALLRFDRQSRDRPHLQALNRDRLAGLFAGAAGAILDAPECCVEIDLVITDQVMPEMTEAELFKVIRAEWPKISVILASGFAETPSDVVALTRLSKPFTQADLAESIASLYQSNRQKRPLVATPQSRKPKREIIRTAPQWPCHGVRVLGSACRRGPCRSFLPEATLILFCRFMKLSTLLRA